MSFAVELQRVDDRAKCECEGGAAHRCVLPLTGRTVLCSVGSAVVRARSNCELLSCTLFSCVAS
jgi:hypothetical protein